MKTVFNRSLRRHKHEDPTSSKALYKKAHNSWEICDYQEVGMTFEEWWRGTLLFHQKLLAIGIDDPVPNKKKEYREWYKMYKAK